MFEYWFDDLGNTFQSDSTDTKSNNLSTKSEDQDTTVSVDSVQNLAFAQELPSNTSYVSTKILPFEVVDQQDP